VPRVKSPICLIHELSDEHYEVSALDLPGFSKLRLWLFDFEATGLDTSKERITQIAGVPLEGGQILEDEAFTQLVFPGSGVEISDEVQQLTGITPDMLEHEPPLPEAWEEFERAAAGSDLWVGQSVFEFDVPLMRAEFARHDMPLELPPILDSVVLATALLGEPEGRWSTSALIHQLGVDIGSLRRHDALDDVKILGLILLPLLEKIRSEHDDRLQLPEGERLSVKRHPPVHS
jgi:DNA polymerase-3 subunit alpha (Gram-positive type)